MLLLNVEEALRISTAIVAVTLIQAVLRMIVTLTMITKEASFKRIPQAVITEVTTDIMEAITKEATLTCTNRRSDTSDLSHTTGSIAYFISQFVVFNKPLLLSNYISSTHIYALALTEEMY